MPSTHRLRPPVLLLSTACAVLGLAVPAGAATISTTFEHTARSQSFVVPDGVDSLDVVAIGGRGGTGQATGEPGTGAGGRGARVTGTIAVEPGQRLWVEVGGNGVDYGCAARDISDPAAAYNGGGRGGGLLGWGCSYRAGGGGGASDVRVCAPGEACPDAEDPLGRLIVAAGGGGGGRFTDRPRGRGGDALVAGETVVDTNGPAGGGGAGTDDAGGASGVSSSFPPGAEAEAGRLGAGGAGASSSQAWPAHGGGGGGGRYGGGGGGTTWYYAGGGGGGSNLVPPGGDATLDESGTPQVTLAYDVGAPASIDAPLFANGASEVTLLAGVEWGTRVTTVVRDADGTPIPGLDVTFAASGADVDLEETEDNGDGSYTTHVTAAAESGTATVTAQIASPAITSPGAQVHNVDRPIVTAPADDTLVLDTADGPARITVSGTADPAVDRVDVACVSSDGIDRLGSEVPVADGAWSLVDAPLVNAHEEGAATRCTVVAVPSGLPFHVVLSDDEAPGPLVRRLVLSNYGNDDGTVWYSVGIPALSGDVSFEALGTGCLRLRGLPDLFGDSETWLRCGAGIADDDDDAGDAALTVDARRVFTPAQLGDRYGSIDGQPNLTVTTAVAGDGSFVVTERSPLARCTATDGVPGDASECGALVGAGVTAIVRLVVSPSGEHAEQQIAFESTDGQQHSVSAALTTRTGWDDTEARLGDERAWTIREEPAAVAASTGPYSALFRDAGGSEEPPPPPPFAASAWTGTPAIAATAAAGPQRQLALPSGVEQRYERTVPAGGVVRLAHTFELTDPADVEAAAAERRAGYDLGVEITSVPSATTEADTATIAGTAFDRTGEVRLRVGGAPVTVAADGSWSVTVPLTVGENAIEAIVTSAYGATRSAHATVTRTEQPDHREPEPRQPEPRQPEPRGPDPRQPDARQPDLGDPQPRRPTAPGTQPLVTLTRAPTRARLAQVRRRGLELTVALGGRRAKVTAVLSGGGGRLATISRPRAAKGQLTLRLKPSRRAAARLARLLRKRREVQLRLRLTVRADGKTSTVTRTIRLTR